jgi:hypothetical protein
MTSIKIIVITLSSKSHHELEDIFNNPNEPTRKAMETKPSHLLKILLLLFIMLFVVFSYTFLHEGGHALVGVLSGGRLTEFSLNFFDLSAHVGMDVDFSPLQRVLNNLAGAGLPLLAWFFLLLALPRQGNLAVESLKVGSTLVVLSTLLAWIALPLLFLAGNAPSDDVTNFLRNSGLHPLLVSGAALALYAGGWLLFRSRIPGLRSELTLFQKPDQEVVTPAAWKSVSVMAAAFLLFGLVGFSANGFRLAAGRGDPFQPPSGYRLVTTIDLSEQEHKQETVHTFTIDRARVAGVFLLVEDVNTPYLEVVLTGPEGYSQVILHAEGYTASRDNPHLEELLQAGEYRVILTSRRSPGRISIYGVGSE